MAAVIDTSGYTYNAASLSNTLNINKPSNVSSGDLLIARLTTTAGESFTTPSGWSPLMTASSQAAFFYKFATGSEPSSYTFTKSAAGNFRGMIIRVTGANATTPFTIGTDKTTASSSAPTSDSVTGTSSDGVLVCFGCVINASNDITAPSGMTTAISQQVVSGNDEYVVATLAVGTGATGTKTWSISGAVTSATSSFIINPAAGGSAAPGRITITYRANNTFTFPPGATNPSVEAIGAGGGGGNGAALNRGGGGGGAAYASATPSLVNNRVYNITVPGSAAATVDGGFAQFQDSVTSTVIVKAAGGTKGGNASGISNGSAGPGGTVANSVGTVRTAGSNGIAGGAGGNAASGGTLTGGAGGDTVAGSPPGGGGGGGAILSQPGLASGAGIVVVSFDYTSESVAASDSINVVVDWDRSVNETIIASDTNGIFKTFLKPVSESLTASDNIAKRVTMPEAESVTANDAMVKALVKAYTESLAATDNISKSITRPYAESVAVTDAFVKKPILNRSESLAATDAIVKAINLIRSETIVTTDTINKVISLLRSENLAATDFITKVLNKSYTENLSATDFITKYMQKPVAENISVTDFAFVVLVYLRYYDDIVTASDVISKSFSLNKADSVAVLEAVMKLTLKRFDFDAVTVTDSVFVQSIYSRLATDSVTPTDILYKKMTLVFADNISGSAPPPSTGGRKIFIISD